MKTAVVIGVGPERGLGAQLCLRFAREGLHVVVAGRTQGKLDGVARAIAAAGGSAEAVVADTTREPDLRALFDRAGPDLDLAIYNAGNNVPGRIADMEAETFERAWRVGCFGGFLFAREAVRRMRSRGAGTLLFTGASASLRGRANFGAFNSAKGALRNLAQALAKEVGPEGIHVGHVVVDGAIAGDKIEKRLPQLAEQLGPRGLIDLGGLADAFAFLYRQPPSAWTFELDLRTAAEKW